MKKIKIVLGLLCILSILNANIVYAEPKLEDLELVNYNLYTTTIIDLHDAIKDPGNEYLIRCYANEQLVDEEYGLYGNQLVSYTFKEPSIVGKMVYLEIEGYNSAEKARTEKKILGSAKGKVILHRKGSFVQAYCSEFGMTDNYRYDWYVDGELKKSGFDSFYEVMTGDKSIQCRVYSLQTYYSVDSETLSLLDYQVIRGPVDINAKGEWINGISGKWYQRRDGTHPVGYRDELGLLHYDWQLIDKKWYAFDDFGYLETGWIKDYDGAEYYFSEDNQIGENELFIGWHLINGSWYYFNTENGSNYGQLIKNAITPDGYKVDDRGVWLE